jgi:two-component system CheB/CheR fusion protein
MEPPTDAAPNPPQRSAMPVVAVGASAGGLAACKQLFAAMPPSTGMAFVVVFHLDPTHPSHLAELLQTVTAMSVVQVAESVVLEPDHIYVIAPNTELDLHAGVLASSTPRAQATRGAHKPIDAFLTALAADQKEQAVAVILSGAGNDGAEGIQAIKRWGGLCLVQAPESAEHTEMPRHAIETGVADHVLRPEEMPKLLVERAAEPTDERSGYETASGSSREAFDAILGLLGRRYGLDLRAYKRGTLERRTRRRMGLKQIESWVAYCDYLQEHAEEVDALYRDVLIGVTCFFRDPDAWKYLSETAVPQLLRARASDMPVRAWVAGCATGEEAYSLAVVLLSELERAGIHSKVQIYATDINADALATARRGIYPASIANDVSAPYLARYFHKQGDEYQVTSAVREAVTFATHNLLSDPPFSRLDLVICRNVLIYFTAPVQDRVLELFQFALKREGVLMLGRSETIGPHTDLFETVSKNWRVFRSTATAHPNRYRMPQGSSERAVTLAQQFASAAARRGNDTARVVEQAVLARHASACVAIAENLEILYFFGPTQDYLIQPTGEARLDLLSWVRPGLYPKLRSGLQAAIREKRAVRVEDMRLDRGGVTQRVECTVEPIAGALWLVAFCDQPKVEAPPADADDSIREPLVQQLADELKRTQHELQKTVEQLDRNNEEHRIGQEELLSLNEELQSSNEELETSKEELQSLNEEMNTINRQLEEKNAQLRTINTDLQNLLTSTAVPTIFLDREFRIRFFTPAATELMRLIPSDVGRSILHVKERFRDDRLLDDAKSVLHKLAPLSVEVLAEDGRWYVRRIVPYRSEDDRIDGVCITFSDVSEQKSAASRAEDARLYAESIIRTIRTPLLVLDSELRVVSANDAFYRTFEAQPDDTLGRTIYDLGNKEWNIERLRALLEHVLPESREVTNYDVEHTFEHLGTRFMRLNARVLNRPDGAPLMLVSIEDMTDWKNAESAARRHAEALRDEHRRKDEFLAMLGHELRNPLAALSHGLDALGHAGSSAQAEDVRAMMVRQTSRITAMLDQLLDLARVVSGKIELAHQVVDLTQIVKIAIEAVQPLITERDQVLTTELPASGTCSVVGDAMRLAQVVENLLLNASKYTEQRGRIWLTVEASEETARIRVRDTGVGIDADLLPHVFDIFTQAPRSLDRAKGGLGLGLALVRSLVEMHGGHVSAASGGAGQGSEFVIALPRLLTRAAAPPPEARPPAAPAEVPPRRVLIVDDEPDIATTLADILEQQGHATRTAERGAAALELCRSFAPDVALLDLGLPDLDGYELARRMRTLKRDVVLVAMTGYERNARRLEAASFDHHLIKPIDLHALRNLLAEASPAARGPAQAAGVEARPSR